MYGFENYHYTSRMTHTTRYHYFDMETGMTNVHSFELSMNVYNFLSTRFDVFLHSRDADGAHVVTKGGFVVQKTPAPELARATRHVAEGRGGPFLTRSRGGKHRHRAEGGGHEDREASKESKDGAKEGTAELKELEKEQAEMGEMEKAEKDTETEEGNRKVTVAHGFEKEGDEDRDSMQPETMTRAPQEQSAAQQEADVNGEDASEPSEHEAPTRLVKKTKKVNPHRHLPIFQAAAATGRAGEGSQDVPAPALDVADMAR